MKTKHYEMSTLKTTRQASVTLEYLMPAMSLETLCWLPIGHEQECTHLDSSLALKYNHSAFAAFDIYTLKRYATEAEYIADNLYTQEEIADAQKYWDKHLLNNNERSSELTNMITAGLPGAQEGFTLDNFRDAVDQYKNINTNDLRKNIAYFLDSVIPTAQKAGVRLCCHPDAPSFSPFTGTPRGVDCVVGYKFLLDHGCGVNLCSGSLIPNEDNRNIAKIFMKQPNTDKQKA